MKHGFIIIPRTPRSSPDSGQQNGAKGILLIDYLSKGKTTNGAYYSNLPEKPHQRILEKRSGLTKKKIMFHQDNAPRYKSHAVIDKIERLSPNLKKVLVAKNFGQMPK
ncbi:uncharacterized protein [Euwallacea fornicatus]|uniref:uncharacterized protein n=1 Tax=Euwallacea fornicatus TaxID=995702 RepID=UPI0033905254